MLLGLAGTALASDKDIYTVTKKDNGIFLCYDDGEGYCPFALGDGGRCMGPAARTNLSCPFPHNYLQHTKKWLKRVAAYKLLK